MKWVLWLFAVLLATACSSGSGASKNEEPKAGEPPVYAPVTLTMYSAPDRMTEEDFRLLITEPLRQKFPHITMQIVYGASAEMETKLITSGNPTDLVLFWNGELDRLLQWDLMDDIRSVMQSRQFDINRYAPNMLEAVTGAGGELYGLPFHNNINVLYYNQEIFNRFGIAYPKDGLYWDEVVELTRSLTRVDQGVQYWGFSYGPSPNNGYRLHAPLSLNPVDGNLRASVNNAQWINVLQLMKSLQNLNEGNLPRKSFAVEFLQDRNLAMAADVIQLIGRDVLREGAISWDMAQYPSWRERPNTFSYADLHVVGITKPSKNKEAAMLVLETLLSEEVQLMSVRKTGRVSPLKAQRLQDEYGAEVPHLQGKRFQSIFKSKAAPFPAGGLTKYFSDSRAILAKHVTSMLENKVDINTALRQTEEEINQFIASQERTQ